MFTSSEKTRLLPVSVYFFALQGEVRWETLGRDYRLPVCDPALIMGNSLSGSRMTFTKSFVVVSLGSWKPGGAGPGLAYGFV
jgi:hypothetical protein